MFNHLSLQRTAFVRPLERLGIVWLKYSTNAGVRSLNSSTDLKLPRLCSLRTSMLNHSSIWLKEEVTLEGVYTKRMR